MRTAGDQECDCGNVSSPNYPALNRDRSRTGKDSATPSKPIMGNETRATLFDLTDKLVWVAGQHGMVGRAMTRRLEREPCALLLDPGRTAVDLRRQSGVEDWMASRRPRTAAGCRETLRPERAIIDSRLGGKTIPGGGKSYLEASRNA
jgi:uncharacterized protein YbjT (DUF2867 family)